MLDNLCSIAPLFLAGRRAKKKPETSLHERSLHNCAFTTVPLQYTWLYKYYVATTCLYKYSSYNCTVSHLRAYMYNTFS